ncbi:cytoplasmic protein [Lentinula edodes]|uniref:Cytoplasmic protein n=1 Tax=Lentinula edodes TaxID=5353 RepID=A0A1Q3E3Z2_LENED|nr:cytoplasmic protein [Lentinula edodes]
MATYTDFSDIPTNLARPKTSATLTISISKPQLSVNSKIFLVKPGWKPYRNVQLDTLKLYTQAHGAKTTNLIINLDHDEWILADDSTLADAGFENETEVSFFNRDLYEQFKQDPETTW